jgi:biotin operon repressor
MLKKNDEAHLPAKESFLAKRERWARFVVNNPDLGEWPRIVGISLALRMSEAKPYAWPGQATIANDVGCARATVNRAIGKLVDVGFLVRTNQKLGADSDKDSRQYTYTIRMPFEF